jgi:2-oxoglutarate dehydrogenase E2 component (dihydrolipoamide succinyltransferase)
MAIEIKVPTVGESITEGTVARWLKKDGEAVRADEPLYELETEKATTEVASPAAGTLRIKVNEGQTVAIGAVIGRIEDVAANAVVTDGKATPPPAAKPASGSTKPIEVKSKDTEVPVSPAVRRLANEASVDVRQVSGSGPGGRVTKEDLITYIERRKPETPGSPAQPTATPTEASTASRDEAKPKPLSAGVTRQRMSSIRQRIADRLVAAQHTAAILTTFNEADMSAVMAIRNRYKDAFQKKHGIGLGFMSFFVKAAVDALRAFPVVNAWIDGSDIVYHHDCNIGVAVSTEKGLMVPVLRNAESMTFAQIEKRIGELAQKARDGKIAVDDLQGGTFTITNGGVFGSLVSTPILNPPQSAILGMHAIQKRPIAVDDQVVIRPMMYLALSYDHRLIDGKDAVQFLVRIKECIEGPERLLLEI